MAVAKRTPSTTTVPSTRVGRTPARRRDPQDAPTRPITDEDRCPRVPRQANGDLADCEQECEPDRGRKPVPARLAYAREDPSADRDRRDADDEDARVGPDQGAEETGLRPIPSAPEPVSGLRAGGRGSTHEVSAVGLGAGTERDDLHSSNHQQRSRRSSDGRPRSRARRSNRATTVSVASAPGVVMTTPGTMNRPSGCGRAGSAGGASRRGRSRASTRRRAGGTGSASDGSRAAGWPRGSPSRRRTPSPSSHLDRAGRCSEAHACRSGRPLPGYGAPASVAVAALRSSEQLSATTTSPSTRWRAIMPRGRRSRTGRCSPPRSGTA